MANLSRPPAALGQQIFSTPHFLVTRQCELNCSSSNDCSDDLERSRGSCWPSCLIAQACALEHIAIGRSPQPLGCSNRLFPLCCRPPPPSAMVHPSSTATAAAALRRLVAAGKTACLLAFGQLQSRNFKRLISRLLTTWIPCRTQVARPLFLVGRAL